MLRKKEESTKEVRHRRKKRASGDVISRSAMRYKNVIHRHRTRRVILTVKDPIQWSGSTEERGKMRRGKD